ncbi:zinc transporter 2-like isoform X2 [Brienomyrus brachyistius]|uniref:zinc transporter 2-like isoform X2 n=1 Tax=Brienomyrus brachyistius TaxID=42636 RepID=UPI0020B2A9F1|nr:zinc transporter 2-like isoform X2 [Brienomyrus brachyistius]
MQAADEKTKLLQQQRLLRASQASSAAEKLIGQCHCHSSTGDSIGRTEEKRRARLQLYRASTVCLIFIIGQVVGGCLAHSLAILADAAHLLVDFASMLLSLFSLWVASRPATKVMSFGWHRAEMLGALLSVLSIWLVTAALVSMAVWRLMSQDFHIDGGIMLITSGCAVAANIVMGITLHQSAHAHGPFRNGPGPQRLQPNASVRGAFIHVIGDLLQSLGVLLTSYVIYFEPEYRIIDPICTFLFSVLVLGTTLTVLRDVLTVLMEGTPPGLHFTQVKQSLLSVCGVRQLHSLHIWALTVNQPMLSVHIAVEDGAEVQTLLKEASQMLQSQYGFHTITIQIEDYSEDMVHCHQCQDPAE